MMRASTFLWIFVCLLPLGAVCRHVVPGGDVPKWKFSGIFGTFDRPAVQRGYQVYREVCSSCHSMKRLAFRNLREVGFSEAEVKAIAGSYTVTDGPNESGDMFERPGIPSDYFPRPFPNKEAAAAANNGANPPDLSLMIKARHSGPDYVYKLLTSYQGADADENGLYANPVFSAGRIAMAPPLSEGLVGYMDGTEASIENMARDVVNFLQWAAEPEMEARKKLGIKVVVSLMAGTVLVTMVNRRLWNMLRK
ncbi:cytochrome c1 [Anaplasma phagocytophilum]|uniref:Cytochrome c1 n=1 Tax=Anaplasma phagocytophilum (strain HZ) TaxID=212042 RepID=Q2GKU3_ANAPZ|nr:cytochrome c1 [Anaplasma phagocytophilum]ABD44387.1 ubiquinol-cytochrome c reductase, cytochrome c1 [Anaplasma phagocytophilum str. HZ]AGR78777.1 cytochrome C [Anaplasma phagocytophilum str. HZ2]